MSSVRQDTEPVALREAIAEYAAELARRGWHIFPCLPGDKRPAVDRWEQRACSDPERIARYWPGPRHNIGVACGPSGLVVIDLDTHGQLPEEWQMPGIRDGLDVLAQLCEWAGQPWPSTYTVATPSGGWHLYFRSGGLNIRNSAGRIGPLIDVRGNGGYVVGPGSVVGGVGYEVLDGNGPAPLPRWLARLLAPPPQAPRTATLPDRATPARLAGILHTVEAAAEGQRNSTLHWAACRAAEMTAAGEVDEASVTAALTAAAAAAGLSEREAARTIGSAMRGGAR